MMVARWKDHILARSNQTIVIEGNHYFPPDSVNKTLLEASDHHTHCHWKGEASYQHIVVADDRNENAAWYYPDPKPQAESIANHIAFWKGVEISKE